MVTFGDNYEDLVDAVERGLEVEPGRDVLSERYSISLDTWDAMVTCLMDQLIDETGSLRRALIRLSIPTAGLTHAWTRGVTPGMRASAAWLAAWRRTQLPHTLVLTSRVRALRGDDYGDLAEAAGAGALTGDGALEPARLRRLYWVSRAPWLRMIADLLGQVVGDAGSVERAASVLGVAPEDLFDWVRVFLSRGSARAARSRWPVAPAGDELELSAYLDLAEAVERGAVDGDNAIDPPRVREVYMVRLDSWTRMEAELLGQIVADAGSIRRAATVLSVPRSTLGSWIRRQGRF